MIEEQRDTEEILRQFNRLVRELLRGQINRNSFRPWEVELLLDIDNCHLTESTKEGILHRYQRAVQRRLDRGANVPMKLSEYLRRKP